MPGSVHFLLCTAIQNKAKTLASTGLGQLELGSRKEHVEGRLRRANRVGTGKSMTQSKQFPQR